MNLQVIKGCTYKVRQGAYTGVYQATYTERFQGIWVCLLARISGDGDEFLMLTIDGLHAKLNGYGFDFSIRYAFSLDEVWEDTEGLRVSVTETSDGSFYAKDGDDTVYRYDQNGDSLLHSPLVRFIKR
jgi:hypothetical protein